MKKIKNTKTAVLFLLGSLAMIPMIYYIPAVQGRIDWRVNDILAKLKYSISPPEEAIFIPQEAPPTASPLSTPTVASPGLQITPSPTKAPDLSLAPLPQNVFLKDIQHEYQTWNNCGPATLAMALSYWGWDGDQRSIAASTKPNPRDKNVMPYELSGFITKETDFEVIYRTGGDIQLLKRFLTAELPVIIEKGFEGRDFDGWMGHYVLATGYDEADRQFIVQDSYYGPDQVIGYDELESYWRAFNFTYLVLYPSEHSLKVTAILGPHADVDYNNRHAEQVALDEIEQLTGRDLFFAWFNLGSSRVQLRDYAGAALSFDKAFAVYPNIPNNERPWRMMWYQTGPYWAYYYTGRYQDVIDLASTTLGAMSEPVLEESYYWRALSREALGDGEEAVRDLRTALKYHPGFEPAIARLQQLEVAP